MVWGMGASHQKRPYMDWHQKCWPFRPTTNITNNIFSGILAGKYQSLITDIWYPYICIIHTYMYIYIPMGSVYGIHAAWTGYIDGIHVTIYSSTMDPSWDIYIYIHVPYHIFLNRQKTSDHSQGQHFGSKALCGFPDLQIWPQKRAPRSLASGKLMENHGKTMGKPWEKGDLYGKSPFLMGKSTISMGHVQ